MVLVSVVTAVAALALLGALLLAFSGWHRWMLVMAACVGLCSTVSRMLRTVPDEWVLEEADDPELMAVVARLCALIDIERPDIVLSPQDQPNIANRDALVMSAVGLPSAMMIRGGRGWPYAVFALAGDITQTGRCSCRATGSWRPMQAPLPG
jgi:hypothetical protein